VSFESVPDRDDRATVHLVGELDLAAASRFEQAVFSIVEDQGSLRLEIKRLTFLDSTGITALVRVHHRLVDRGSQLVLAAPQRQVRRVLEVTGLDRVFVIDEG
jgi:anti-anti-sigma factor